VREKERENGEENLVLHIRNARMFCVLQKQRKKKRELLRELK